MADAEFHDPERIQLLESLKTALKVDVIPPTAWACLWLSDIVRLRECVRDAQLNSYSSMASFYYLERMINVVQICGFTILIL